ncbi:AraC family transcriptional regulator [Curtobacterium sp. VKM Ac-2865]|uniref:helix-turn-helix transcriptional regulator n=1 Tax=Curtobacterium sp. VKM Ac-2865 TaxID=2783817 RepID=UPI00188C2B6E|nr:AraC family transcriptional regulator [Curtobacterium sp. VKM Ac-2865]MBF4583824.1 AraC family transcriptional regulator [Curtobacterium sp. VKM Ac-2865]
MSSVEPVPVDIGIRLTEPAAASAAITTLYGGIDLTVDQLDDSFSFRYTARGDDTMTMRSSHFSGRLAGEVPPGDDVVVQWLTSGTGWFDTGSSPLELTPGRPVPLLPQRTFSFEMSDYDQRLVHLDRALVERVASEGGSDVGGGLRFDMHAGPSPAAVRAWHNSAALVAHTLRDDGSGGLLHREMARLMSAALLEMYPLSPLPDLGTSRVRSAHVRAAVEYVHAHAHLPITTTTVAEAVDVGLRALQEAFRSELGVTPNEYVRSVRLDRARDELLQTDPTTTMVRDVARRWGFLHLGRFSQTYASRFGEYPRDTLSR